MPPHVPRKRLRDEAGPHADGEQQTPKKKAKATAAVVAPPRKATLFDDLDATATPRSSTRTSGATQLVEDDDGSSGDESSLTSLSDADFEDVPGAKLQTAAGPSKPGPDEPDDDDDEDIVFEDVPAAYSAPSAEPVISGDLSITLSRDTGINFEAMMGDKKGPSKKDRQRRIASHHVHVQYLLWHNAIRNSWLCDPLLQGILLSYLPPSLWAEVERWRRNSGLEMPEEPPKKATPSRGKAKAPARGRKGKAGAASAPPTRDWGDAAQRLEKGAVDMSHGDPLFRLVKTLSAWWKQRFRVTAPGLRKWGYMPLERLARITRGYRTGEHDPELYGERIRSLDEFRQRAQECSGSRDVGAQLFTALLRALGLDARMVASLQPVGFGWTKAEEADPEKKAKANTADQSPASVAKPAAEATESKSRRQSKRASKEAQEEIDESDYFELIGDDSDNESIVELSFLPKKSKVYDKDLEYPHYWTEVLSPVTNKYLPVDAIVKSILGTSRELVDSFEPRGSTADKSKQVIAYVIGYSQDGTAKDVTVRYLKRQVLPGRTKGMRFPIEKVPVHNKNGKVKRYDQFDWFRSVMRGYTRGTRKHPITDVDEEEEATDLKPALPQKREVKEGEETLQYYKQSAEFVLERHLKREEALLPTAKPVKVFNSKGKGGQAVEENVYLRKDVAQVKSAETWHKQGRAPIAGVQPLKRAPYRAATTNRRREIAEAEAATGQKVLQGLYSYDQTEWIIPPPIQNGVIPKNEYGNIDLFVEHMCPEGAVHVPYRGAVRVCKRMGIDYAEAVVDFEFGHRMAVPVIQGVVIAEEYHDEAMAEIAKDEAERARKEDEKRRKAALEKWRKLLMGMRIIERIRRDHGYIEDDLRVFGHSGKEQVDALGGDGGQRREEDMAGGFLPQGYEEEREGELHHTSGFFPVVEDEGEGGDDDGGDAGGPVMEEAEGVVVAPSEPEEVPAPDDKPARARRRGGGAASSRRRRRAPSPSEDDDDDDSDDEYVGSE